MYKRYYDGYAKVRNEADDGEVIVPQNTYNSNDCNQTVSKYECSITNKDEPVKKGFSLGSLELDDLILIGVLIFLMYDSDNEDYILPLIIGIVFLSDRL